MKIIEKSRLIRDENVKAKEYMLGQGDSLYEDSIMGWLFGEHDI